MPSPCLNFTEHPGWRQKHPPSHGVTFDGWCSRCGFKIEDAKLDHGSGLSSHGKRIAMCMSRRVIDGEIYVSTTEKAYCSDCVPSLLGQPKDE